MLKEKKMQGKRTLRVVDDDIASPYIIVPDRYLFYKVVSVFVSLS